MHSKTSQICKVKMPLGYDPEHLNNKHEKRVGRVESQWARLDLPVLRVQWVLWMPMPRVSGPEA